jgi:O-antigen/teichoic acid export membrane protein
MRWDDPTPDPTDEAGLQSSPQTPPSSSSAAAPPSGAEVEGERTTTDWAGWTRSMRSLNAFNPVDTGSLPVVRLPSRSLADLGSTSYSPEKVAAQASLSSYAPTDQPTSAVDISALPTLKMPQIAPGSALPGSSAALTGAWSAEDFAAAGDKTLMPTWVLPVVRPELINQRTQAHQAVVASAEGYLTLLGNLVRSTGIYGIAAMGAPLVTMALSPFLARNLSLSDFGALTILNTVIALAAGITQLGLGSAFFRAYSFDYSSQRDRRAVVATTSILIGAASALMLVAVAQSASFLATLLFGRPDLSQIVVLAADVVLAQNLTIPCFAWLRAESKAAIYSTLAIGSVVITLVANIALVGILQLGVAGSLLATGIGYTSVALTTFPVVMLWGQLRVRFDVARNLLSFGLPLVLNFLAYWVLQLSDRYFLSVFGSLSDTATYSVAYLIGSAVNVAIIAPFTLAWPTTMYAIAKRRDAARIFQLIFRWLSILLLLSAYALSLAGDIILGVAFPASYQSASVVIPIIAQSLVFYGVYFVFMAGVNVTRRTWLAAVFTTVAAVINVGFNLLLIPLYGQVGAAASTLIAYVALAALAYIVNQRIYPVPYEIGRFSIAIVVGVAIFSVSSLAGGTIGPQWTWATHIGAFALYTALLFTLVWPTWSAARQVVRRMRAPRAAGRATN